MNTVTNIQKTNGYTTYFEEDGKTFFITLNSAGKPAFIQSKRGKWDDKCGTLIYNDAGVFVGLTGDLETTMLPKIIQEANGITGSYLDPTSGITSLNLDGATPNIGRSAEGNLVLSKNPSIGIMVDTDEPTFGWRDLIGQINPKTSGAGSPTLVTWNGHIRGWAYGNGDDGDSDYHIPHDYLPGSDLFLHLHWTHNGTNISGNFVVTCYITYAKGHRRGQFSLEKTLTISDSALNITNTPPLMHCIPEVQLSTPGGSASMLDTSLIEVDGVIEIHYDVVQIPTITGGAAKPILLTMDIHYQSTNSATKQKSPDFYT